MQFTVKQDHDDWGEVYLGVWAVLEQMPPDTPASSALRCAVRKLTGLGTGDAGEREDKAIIAEELVARAKESGDSGYAHLANLVKASAADPSVLTRGNPIESPVAVLPEAAAYWDAYQSVVCAAPAAAAMDHEMYRSLLYSQPCGDDALADKIRVAAHFALHKVQIESEEDDVEPAIDLPAQEARLFHVSACDLLALVRSPMTYKELQAEMTRAGARIGDELYIRSLISVAGRDWRLALALNAQRLGFSGFGDV